MGPARGAARLITDHARTLERRAISDETALCYAAQVQYRPDAGCGFRRAQRSRLWRRSPMPLQPSQQRLSQCEAFHSGPSSTDGRGNPADHRNQRGDPGLQPPGGQFGTHGNRFGERHSGIAATLRYLRGRPTRHGNKSMSGGGGRPQPARQTQHRTSGRCGAFAGSLLRQTEPGKPHRKDCSPTKGCQQYDHPASWKCVQHTAHSDYPSLRYSCIVNAMLATGSLSVAYGGSVFPTEAGTTKIGGHDKPSGYPIDEVVVDGIATDHGVQQDPFDRECRHGSQRE